MVDHYSLYKEHFEQWILSYQQPKLTSIKAGHGFLCGMCNKTADLTLKGLTYSYNAYICKGCYESTVTAGNNIAGKMLMAINKGFFIITSRYNLYPLTEEDKSDSEAFEFVRATMLGVAGDTEVLATRSLLTGKVISIMPPCQITAIIYGLEEQGMQFAEYSINGEPLNLLTTEGKIRIP